MQIYFDSILKRENLLNYFIGMNKDKQITNDDENILGQHFTE